MHRPGYEATSYAFYRKFDAFHIRDVISLGIE